MDSVVEQTRTTRTPSKVLVVGSVVLVILIAVFAGRYVLQQRRSERERGAKQQLSQLNAIAQLDANAKFVQTVMIRQNLPEALAIVQDLPGITHLDLADTDFADDQLTQLTRLKKLNSLVLSNTKISDAGVAQLAAWPLESLFLARTEISAAALDDLAKVSTLQILDLSETGVQDNLAALAQLPQLEWLVLNQVDLSGLSDTALDALGQMPKLGRLTANGSGLSSTAVARLKSVKPALNVEASPADQVVPVPSAEDSL